MRIQGINPNLRLITGEGINELFVPFGGHGRVLSDSRYNEFETSSMLEAFPWLVDDDGKPLDFNRTISVFEGVDLISRFLDKRYNLNSDRLDLEGCLGDILKGDDNGELTMMEVFTRVSALYKQGKITEKKLSDLGINGIETVLSDETSEEIDPVEDLNRISLNNWGDMTINEVWGVIKNWKVESVIGGGKLTLHVVPLAATAISYGLLLKAYVKHVHNKPYPEGITGESLTAFKLMRMHNLGVFALLGAPILGILLKKTIGLGLKDMIDVEIKAGESFSMSSNLKESSGSSLLLILGKFYNNIPNWVKVFFSVILLGVFLLNVFDSSCLAGFVLYGKALLKNIFYIKILLNFLCLLIIFYQLLILFLMYRFKDGVGGRNDLVSRVLLREGKWVYAPKFIVNWLKNIQIISSSTDGIKELRKMCYIEMLLYLVIMLLISFIL